MKDPVINGLHSQYVAVTEMLALAIEHCPDEYWTREFGDESPFWKEAYHMLHYFVKYAHGADNAVYTPFGEMLDPTLVNKPHITLSRETILSYIGQTRDHIEKFFTEITPDQLAFKDTYAPDRYQSVFHRLVYGLRHGQHHVGKLTGYLFCNGIDYDPWR